MAGTIKKLSLAIALCTAFLTPAHAHDYTVGTLQIIHPWTRPASGKVGGGFMTITNNGTEMERLKGGTLEWAGKFEIHQTIVQNGVLKMRPLAAGMEIKPSETVELFPGAAHVMFQDLRKPIEVGDVVKGTLLFARAGEVKVEYRVEIKVPTSDGHVDHGH